MLNATAVDKVDTGVEAIGMGWLARLGYRLPEDELYACDARYR